MSDTSFPQVLRTLSIYAPLLPLLVGLIRRSKLRFPQYIIGCFALLSIVTEVIAAFLNRNGQTNAPLYHTFVLVEAVLMYILFRHLLTSNRHRSISTVLFLLLIGFALFNGLYFQPFWAEFNTYSIIASNSIILIYCSMFLYEHLVNTSLTPIYNRPIFIPVIVLMLYSTCTFLVWVWMLLFPDRLSLLISLMLWNSLFNILKYLGFAYFLWKAPKI